MTTGHTSFESIDLLEKSISLRQASPLGLTKHLCPRHDEIK